MHGTEHCKQEHRTPRLSVPRQPFWPLPDQHFKTRRGNSLLPGTGRSYRPFARLQQFTLSRVPFQGQCSQPDPSRPYQLLPLPVRLSAPPPIPVRPKIGSFHALSPLQLPQPAWPAAIPASTPRAGLLHPSGSKRSAVPLPASPPSEPARSPFAPHSRYLSLEFRLRIIVPGPLRFRRLAVPQTSWNHLHYDPELLFRQSLLYRPMPFFLNLFLLCFK
jgi:hypothetical protein